MDNIKIFEKINKIIDAPVTKYTREEAIKTLQDVGILDRDGKVVEAYKDIIILKNS